MVLRFNFMMNLSIGQLDLAKPRNEGDDKVYCFMATGYRWGSGATRGYGYHWLSIFPKKDLAV